MTLRDQDVCEAVLRLADEFQPDLRFALHVAERIALHEPERHHVIAAVGPYSEISGLLRGLEGASQEIDAGADVPRPLVDEGPNTKYTRALKRRRPRRSMRSKPSLPKRNAAR